jgi:hypothetical protein
MTDPATVQAMTVCIWSLVFFGVAALYWLSAIPPHKP